MKDSDAMPNTEMQLELLLRRLLREDHGEPGASPADDGVSPELRELRDLALRLRVARQHLPVSASLRVVRAMESAAAWRGGDSGVTRVRSRSPRWHAGWAAVAAAVLLGAFGLGVGAISAGASPSSPWYGARLAIENVQVELTPSAFARAELLVKNAHARVAEIHDGRDRRCQRPSPRRRCVGCGRGLAARGPQHTASARTASVDSGARKGLRLVDDPAGLTRGLRNEEEQHYALVSKQPHGVYDRIRRGPSWVGGTGDAAAGS